MDVDRRAVGWGRWDRPLNRRSDRLSPRYGVDQCRARAGNRCLASGRCRHGGRAWSRSIAWGSLKSPWRISRSRREWGDNLGEGFAEGLPRHYTASAALVPDLSPGDPDQIDEEILLSVS